MIGENFVEEKHVVPSYEYLTELNFSNYDRSLFSKYFHLVINVIKQLFNGIKLKLMYILAYKLRNFGQNLDEI